MKLLDFVIIRLSIFLILGIIVAYYFPVPLDFSIYLSLAVFVLFGSTLLLYRKTFKRSPVFGLLTYSLVLILGILVYNLHDPRNSQNHYTNKNIDLAINHTLVLEVVEKLKPTLYQDKYKVRILKIDRVNVSGNSILNISKDSIGKDLQVDDIIALKSKITEINKPLNPGQFNYKDYLEKQYVYHQINTKHEDLIIINIDNKNSLMGIAASIRNRINNELRKHEFEPDELAIINALLLGQREDISRETYNNYTNAGAIHILAVSGLHVGIILFILQFLLQPLNYIKYGRYYRMGVILLFIWSFAIIAGLSPSVTRAVTMFTAITIAINLKRANNIYNTLAISAFVLLLIKPMFLFQVGFQLSYLAVLSIVTFQPIFFKWLSFESVVLKYFWGLFTVTLAAQIGVAPLSLFYFHQFPGLFFVSNLVILPFLGLILGLGILVIVLALSGLLFGIIAKIYGSLISAMNLVVEWVSSQESFLFKDISFNSFNVIASYIFVISLLLLLKLKLNRGLKYVLVGVIGLQIVALYNLSNSDESETIVFNRNRMTVIGERHNSHLIVYSDLDSGFIRDQSFIRDYKIKSDIESIEFNSILNVFEIQGKKVLLIDSLAVYQVDSFKPEIVLLRNSPKLNLSRMIDSISPELIIADGSNYKSYVARWKATSDQKKIPFHATAEKGAYIFR